MGLIILKKGIYSPQRLGHSQFARNRLVGRRPLTEKNKLFLKQLGFRVLC
jgi:hypothetical protein